MRDFIYRWWVCRGGGGGWRGRGRGLGWMEVGKKGGRGRGLEGVWWCSQIYYFVFFFLCDSFVGFFVNLNVCVMVLNLLLFIKELDKDYGGGGGGGGGGEGGF